MPADARAPSPPRYRSILRATMGCNVSNTRNAWTRWRGDNSGLRISGNSPMHRLPIPSRLVWRNPSSPIRADTRSSAGRPSGRIWRCSRADARALKSTPISAAEADANRARCTSRWPAIACSLATPRARNCSSSSSSRCDSREIALATTATPRISNCRQGSSAEPARSASSTNADRHTGLARHLLSALSATATPCGSRALCKPGSLASLAAKRSMAVSQT